MPTFSHSLEQSLHRALALANERHHEYATLEHLLLSLIDDSVKLVLHNQSNDRQADTVVLQSTTDNTSKLAEKVLDSTINIPPLIYQNQGGIVGIYVARDVDFSSVYELKPTASDPPREGAR